MRDDNPVFIFEHKLLYGSSGARKEDHAIQVDEPVPEEEQVAEQEFGHYGDLESHGRVDVMGDLTTKDAERLHMLISNHARYTGSKRAAEILAMLRDPKRCQVVLVTLPEETPVNETIETAFHIEDRVGVQLAPIVVNGFDADGLTVPDPDSADARSDPAEQRLGGLTTRPTDVPRSA